MSNLRLNALFDNIATNSLSRAQLHASGDVQNLHYGDIHLKYSGILNLNNSSLPYAQKSDYKFKPGAELQTGDVVFADAAEDYEGIGKAVEIGIQGNVAAYAGLHTIHLRKKTDLLYNGYIGYLTQSPRFRRQIWFIAQGAKVLGISSKEVLKLEIEIPELSYQSKVVNTLKSVDHKINLLAKKKQALEAYKKGLMQKIFSQELRFKREDGTDYPDWRIVSYSEFLSERDIKHPQSEKFPLCSFVAHKGVVPKGDRYDREFLVKDPEGKKYKRTMKGDFIYSSNNLETGSIGLNHFGDGCISTVYSVFRIDKSCDINFISNYLVTNANCYKMIRYRQGVMYGQWRIHESDFLKIKVELPSIEEQKSIGRIIQSLNACIGELEKLLIASNQFKKALLQQMFV